MDDIFSSSNNNETINQKTCLINDNNLNETAQNNKYSSEFINEVLINDQILNNKTDIIENEINIQEGIQNQIENDNQCYEAEKIELDEKEPNEDTKMDSNNQTISKKFIIESINDNSIQIENNKKLEEAIQFSNNYKKEEEKIEIDQPVSLIENKTKEPSFNFQIVEDKNCDKEKVKFPVQNDNLELIDDSEETIKNDNDKIDQIEKIEIDPADISMNNNDNSILNKQNIETDELENKIQNKEEELKENSVNEMEAENNDIINYSNNLQLSNSNSIEEKEINKEEVESRNTNNISNNSNKRLFSNVRYYIIESKNENIETLLNQNGAIKDTYLSTFLTHVIFDNLTNDPNSNPIYSEAKEVFELTIVKSDWVEACLKCDSILPIEPYLTENDNRLFSKVKAINLNLTDELAKQVSCMITFYGGQIIDHSQNFDQNELLENATHAFSINFDENTVKLHSNFNQVKIITPDWIIDSINKNELQAETIYNPKYLKNNEEEYQNNKETENIEVDPIEVTTDSIEKPFSPGPAIVTKSFKLITHNPNKNYFNQNTDEIQDKEETLKKKVEDEDIKQERCEFQEEEKNNHPIITSPKTQKPIYTPGFGINVELTNQTPTKSPISKSLTPNSVNSKRSSSCKKRPSPDQNEKTKTAPTTNTFDDSMNEIFNSVINSKVNENEENKTKNKKIDLNTHNGLLPIHIDLIRPVSTQTSLNLVFDCDNENDNQHMSENLESTSINNESTETNLMKESNSTLLFGCVFYIKSNEIIFAKECLNDWNKVIEKFGGRVVSDLNMDDKNSFVQITHVICPNRFTECYKKALEYKKKICTVYWLEDVLQEQKLKAPWLAYHFPSPYDSKNGPLQNHILTTHGFNQDEKLFIRQIIWLLGGKYTSHFSNINSFIICKNSKGFKVDKAKQCNVNIVNANWLMELYLGNSYALAKPLEQRYKQIPNLETSQNYNHFEFDYLLVDDFIQIWKQDLPTEVPLPLKQIISNGKLPHSNLKRSHDNDKNDQIDDTEPNNKIQKNSLTSISWSKPQLNIPCIMFTGLDSTKVAQYQRDVIALGGIISKNPTQTTHLIVDKIERTAKLIKCISTCEFIINVKWLVDSKLNGKFLDPTNYQVKDERFEKHYNCCLVESLERARQKKPLFAGLIFYLSPSVKPSYQDLEEMIRSGGGLVTKDVPPLALISEPFKDENKTNLRSKYVIIGSQSDLCILKPFMERKIPIYSEELVLSGLLIQKLDANLYKFNIQ